MMGYRMREDHPAVEKFEKLCAFAEELGISIEYFGANNVYVTVDGEEYELLDNENMNTPGTFPLTLEYKLILRISD